MNIFVLNEDPKLAARDLCEKHITKMVAESAQLLQNCFSKDVLQSAPLTQSGRFRSHGYYNHPCSKWTRATKTNMTWLIDHVTEMENERLRRGYNPHFSMSFIQWASKNIDVSVCPNGGLQDFAIAISDDKLCRKDQRFAKANSVVKYRLYYAYDKSFAQWKNGAPEWFINLKKEIQSSKPT